MSKMFDVYKMLEKCNSGDTMELGLRASPHNNLIIQVEDNVYRLWVKEYTFDWSCNPPGKVVRKEYEKDRYFTLEELKTLRFDCGNPITDLIMLQVVTDKETFESLPEFDEDRLEMFVLKHRERFYVCGIEGFFFEIPQESVESALKRICIQRVLTISSLREIPSGLEDII